jgi:predicted transcriptional regulator
MARGSLRGHHRGSRTKDDFEQILASEEFVEHFDDAGVRSQVIGDLLAARKASGHSQSYVANVMRTTQSAVSELEGGATDPRLSTLQRYSRAVGAQICIAVVTAVDLDHIPLTPVEQIVTVAQRQTLIDFERVPELVDKAAS